jgi:hypothetical protein
MALAPFGSDSARCISIHASTVALPACHGEARRTQPAVSMAPHVKHTAHGLVGVHNKTTEDAASKVATRLVTDPSPRVFGDDDPDRPHCLV